MTPPVKRRGSAGREPAPGTDRSPGLSVAKGRIVLHESPDGAERGIPWIRFSRGGGPRLWVTATVHGNEVTGMRALQMFYAHLRCAEFIGSVTIAPVINPGGLERNQRELSETSEDLNRFFPGRADGTLAERHARAAFDAIAGDKPDCHVDLHADSTASIAYVILDRYLDARAERLRTRVELLSAAFDALHIYDWPLEQYRSSRLDGSLSGSVLNQAHVPSFTVELGAAGFADETMAELGFRGLVALMARLGMTAAASSGTAPAAVNLRRATPLRAERSGLVRFLVRPGQTVASGAPVAEISDVFCEIVDTVRSPCAGVVIALPDRYWFSPGMSLMTMAVADD